jgi:hypothetical protein
VMSCVIVAETAGWKLVTVEDIGTGLSLDGCVTDTFSMAHDGMVDSAVVLECVNVGDCTLS